MTDIGTPGEDGYGLLDRLRTLDRAPAVPVIALAAFGSAADASRALAAGGAEPLAKPVAPGVLAEAVARAARRGEAAPPSPRG